MNNNMFKTAYFGKAYKTRDGRKAIYSHCINNKIYLMYPHYYINNDSTYINYEYVNKNGYSHDNQHLSDDDIVSEWQEEINEEQLEELAYIKANEKYYDDCNGDSCVSFEYERNIFIEGFRTGYRKSLEK